MSQPVDPLNLQVSEYGPIPARSTVQSDGEQPQGLEC